MNAMHTINARNARNSHIVRCTYYTAMLILHAMPACVLVRHERSTHVVMRCDAMHCVLRGDACDAVRGEQCGAVKAAAMAMASDAYGDDDAVAAAVAAEAAERTRGPLTMLRTHLLRRRAIHAVLLNGIRCNTSAM